MSRFHSENGYSACLELRRDWLILRSVGNIGEVSRQRISPNFGALSLNRAISELILVPDAPFGCVIEPKPPFLNKNAVAIYGSGTTDMRRVLGCC